MLNIITRHDEPCHMEIPDNHYYRKPLFRTENGLYLLSDGDVLPENRLLDAEPTPKVVENNLKNFYLVLLMDHIRRFYAREAVFRWHGRGIGDFECDEPELASVYSAAYSIVQNDNAFRSLHVSFILFHLETRQGQVVFDLSQDKLSRWYVEIADTDFKLIFNLGSALKVWDTPFEAISLSIAEKKKRFRRKIGMKALSGLQIKAWLSLYWGNCFGLWD